MENTTSLEKKLWLIQSLCIVVVYSAMYLAEKFYGIKSLYQLFLLGPILFLFLVKHVFQPKGIMPMGSRSLSLAVAICGSSGISAVVFFLLHIYHK